METLEIEKVDQLWSWLAAHHATENSLRLITWKAAHRDKYVGREAVLDALIVPDDLAAALDLTKWDALAPSYRRNALRWVKLAKTAPTRAKRIAALTEATGRGQKLPQM